MTAPILPPAPRPCTSCPYRVDVPSGIWAAAEYARLVKFDAETGHQPPGLFFCHQNDLDSGRGDRICAGWAGCHGYELLAVRIAYVRKEIDLATAEAIGGYVSPVPLFGSGAEAAAHGMRDIRRPGPKARQMLAKIRRRRRGLRPG